MGVFLFLYGYLKTVEMPPQEEETEKRRKEVMKMKVEDKCEAQTHVLIFPLALQGHVNCMFQLEELLELFDILVTFLNTEHIHRHPMSISSLSHASNQDYPRRPPNQPSLTRRRPHQFDQSD